MADFNESNQIAVLSACRQPLWTLQTDGTSADAAYTGGPANSGSGVVAASAVTAQWQVQMRPRSTATLAAGGVDGRQVVLTVAAVDTSASYVVTLGGTAATYAATGGDTALLILTGIQAAIIANGTLNALVVTSLDSATPALTITGRAEADYTIALATTGTGGLAGVADPTGASMRFWGRGVQGDLSNTQRGYGQQWLLVGGVTGITLDWRGWTDMLAVNGLGSLWIELYSVVGTGDTAPTAPDTLTYAARVVIGPAQVS